jgi:poly-gamma-glutamate capsule biosynthesis protein CapA/YwtB (metallophosphatase superfamily)
MRTIVLAVSGALLLSSASPAAANPPAAGTRITVAASGDFLIHSPVWERARALGHARRYRFGPLFRKIGPTIAKADLALCHVETPFSYGPPRGYPSFRTPVALAQAIKRTGWDACSTASNHTLDDGQRGVNTTLGVLRRAGLAHAGSYRTRQAARHITILQAKGIKVAFLAYTAVTNGQHVPHPWSVNMAGAPRIVNDARRARKAGAQAVIVNLHWGTEFQAAPSSQQRRLAERLTKAQAITAIVGQHVHVVQPIRWMHGKPVVFGEGNLISNQTAACCPRGTQDGLIALLDLAATPTGVRARRVRYLPTYVRHPDFTVVHARGASRRRTIRAAGRSARIVPIR